MRPAGGFRVNRFQVGAFDYLIGPGFLANLFEPAERLSIVAGGVSSIGGEAERRGQKKLGLWQPLPPAHLFSFGQSTLKLLLGPRAIPAAGQRFCPVDRALRPKALSSPA